MKIIPLKDWGNFEKAVTVDISDCQKVEFGGGYVVPPELAEYLRRKFGLPNG
jgi:hypothetical protein